MYFLPWTSTKIRQHNATQLILTLVVFLFCFYITDVFFYQMCKFNFICQMNTLPMTICFDYIQNIQQVE